ncbi:hypothetical protein AVEN_146568-1, partial [Araneus ventricosus]
FDEAPISARGLVIYERPVLKQHKGYCGTDLVMLSCGQLTRTTPEMALPLQASAPYQLACFELVILGRVCLALFYFMACQSEILNI